MHACVLAMQRGSREQHQEPTCTGTGAQRAWMAGVLYVEEEDQFDELELALEKASGNYQEELKRSSAPVLPRSMPVNFAGAIMNVRESAHSITDQFPFSSSWNDTKRRQLFLCGACANYNPDLGRGIIGHSRPVAYGPRALERPRAIRDWSGMADHAPALGLGCIYQVCGFCAGSWGMIQCHASSIPVDAG